MKVSFYSVIGVITFFLGQEFSASGSTPLPVVDWVQQAGGNGNEQVGASSTDPEGNLLLTGSFQTSASFGTVNLGAGNWLQRAAFLQKMTPQGDTVWARTILASPATADYAFFSQGTAIASDSSGSVYLGGEFQVLRSITNLQTGEISTEYPRHTFLAKFASSGEMLWCRTNEASQGTMTVTALAVDRTGSLFVAGAFTGSVSIGQTNLVLGSSDCQNIYLAKYSGAGDFQWVKQGSGGFFSYADALASLDDSSVLFAARFGALGQFNGFTNLVSSNLFFRVSTLGDVISARQVPVAADGGLSLDANGSIYTLAVRAPLKVTLAKYDPAGEFIWLQDITNNAPFTYNIRPKGVVVDASGYVWLGVMYDGESVSFGTNNFQCEGDPAAFIARYDSTGFCEWVGCMTDYQGASSVGIAANKTGSVYWTGTFNTGSAYFNGVTLTNYSQWPDAYRADIFVAGLHSVWPRLNIALANSTVELSWPSWAQGFQLQQNSSQGADAWTPLPFSATSDGSQWTSAVPLTNTTSLFRLKQ